MSMCMYVRPSVRLYFFFSFQASPPPLTMDGHPMLTKNANFVFQCTYRWSYNSRTRNTLPFGCNRQKWFWCFFGGNGGCCYLSFLYGWDGSVGGKGKCRADSVSLVQCFGTLCRLYLIIIVFRIFFNFFFFWGGFIGVKYIFLNGRDDILHIQFLLYWDALDLIILFYFNIRNSKFRRHEVQKTKCTKLKLSALKFF